MAGSMGAGRETCWAHRDAAELPTGEAFNGWDWICRYCEYHFKKSYDNFARDEKCNKCDTKRDWLEQNVGLGRIRSIYPPGHRFD
jgi:hypothetical protein